MKLKVEDIPELLRGPKEVCSIRIPKKLIQVLERDAKKKGYASFSDLVVKVLNRYAEQSHD